MPSKIPISFVIPIYKSQHNIKSMINNIAKVKIFDWEAILVNDNSPDNVHQIIEELIIKYPQRITYIQHRKNMGQQPALMTGFKYAAHQYNATIDDDGQNPPGEILKLFEVLRKKDFDLVYGVPSEKRHNLLRKLLSWINRLTSKFCISNINDITITNVRLLKKSLADSISDISNSYDYLDGLFFSLTSHIGQVQINHLNRTDGKSTYNLVKLLKIYINNIIGYTNTLINSVTIFSFSIAIISFIVGMVYLFSTINLQRPSGWLSTYLTITFLFSMVFLTLGIISQYLGRIYSKINQKNVRLINRVYLHK